MSVDFLTSLLRNDDWSDLEMNSEHHLSKIEGIKALIRLDLDGRFEDLSDDLKKTAVVETAFSSLPTKMRQFEMSLKNELRVGGRILTDYFIICIMPVELKATLIAFGIDPTKRPDRQFNGHRLYQASVTSQDGTVLTIWIGGPGEASDVSCGAFLASMFAQVFEFNKAIMIGIASGNMNSNIQLCDVVSANLVLDLEGRETAKPGFLRRVLGDDAMRQLSVSEIKCEGKLANSLRNYGFDDEALRDEAKNIIGDYSGGSLSFDIKTFGVGYECATIQCAEKMSTNGKLPNTSKDYHDSILAVEFEGSGFSSMCKTLGVEWLIFRGVSDFGNRKRSDKVQANAALIAALYAKNFLYDHGSD